MNFRPLFRNIGVKCWRTAVAQFFRHSWILTHFSQENSFFLCLSESVGRNDRFSYKNYQSWGSVPDFDNFSIKIDHFGLRNFAYEYKIRDTIKMVENTPISRNRSRKAVHKISRSVLISTLAIFLIFYPTWIFYPSFRLLFFFWFFGCIRFFLISIFTLFIALWDILNLIFDAFQCYPQILCPWNVENECFGSKIRPKCALSWKFNSRNAQPVNLLKQLVRFYA